jgi:riboflavin biosynthesis pyrimidine reductase
MRTAMRALRARGIETVSAVGGRTTARALLREGVIDDLYLTTSARSGGEPDTPLFEKPISAPIVLVKEGTGPEEGVQFVHYALR